MFKFVKYYSNLNRNLLKLIAAEYFLQLINTSFMLIMLIYMQKEGYPDHESADYVSFRFLGVLILSVPLGLYIKGKKLHPFFKTAVYFVPALAWIIVQAIHQHQSTLLYISMFLWGISFTLIQIPVLPYILRNTHAQDRTSAIALSYATFSFASISSGFIIFILRNINPVLFTEKLLLEILIIISLAAIFFIKSMVPIEEHFEQDNATRWNLLDFDWTSIIQATVPTLLIAIGAGLTIPFIGIFFYNVHQLDSQNFSLIGAIAAILVAFAAIQVPYIKNKLGFKTAIPLTQSLAILALVLMASTELYKNMHAAIYIAVACYIIRQPLMNMAGPMTSEVVMGYVGNKNREIMSAITAAIWSGSWFISSRIFKVLRESGFPYYQVFFITACLYAIGVILYFALVIKYNIKLKRGEIE
ncbi:hypothetical protein FLAV_01110 [Flavobacteriales bacterium]|nr:MFS transporter [Bacteroidota bacterium]GIK69628.1 MAG: hypothetical protein BroJett020_09230 [Bacteroidota bacterium]CAG0968817.1 hypothetical protein FLAV_01110 [Flavobacteriales bacterium]